MPSLLGVTKMNALRKLLLTSCVLAGIVNCEAKAANTPPPSSPSPPATWIFDPVQAIWYATLGAAGAPGVAVANNEGTKASYSYTFTSITPASSATDIAFISGSSSRTVRVNHVEISCTAGTAANYTASLIRRSATNTGSFTAGAQAYHDINSASSTVSTLGYYTANPSVLGSPSQVIRSSQAFAAQSGVLINSSWDFGTRNDQSIVLRGTSQILAINLNSVTLSSGVCSGSFDWTEDLGS